MVKTVNLPTLTASQGAKRKKMQFHFKRTKMKKKMKLNEAHGITKAQTKQRHWKLMRIHKNDMIFFSKRSKARSTSVVIFQP